MEALPIKKLRKERGLTLAALARLVGTSKQTIHRYECGVITNVPREKLERLADALGVTPSELLGWSGGERLPVLGRISCGVPSFALEEREELSFGGADFCLIAKGDSMTGARILDGDTVYIRSQPTVAQGEIAAVIIGEEATLKRVYYYPDEERLILSAENPAYPPIVLSGSELASVRILGKAVAFKSRLG